MYIINILVPFDILIDTDMGLLKLIEFDYHNEDFFLKGILNTTESNQKYFLMSRFSSNVIEALLTVQDKELAENLYAQFIEKEYDQILNLSCNTAICDLTLLLRSNMNQVIRMTVMCKNEKEVNLIKKRKISCFKTIISDPEKINLDDYGTIFVKNIYDLDKYKRVEGKTIYVPNYGFNVTINPDLPDPLLPKDILLKYGNYNEFEIYTPYVLDPNKIPVV